MKQRKLKILTWHVHGNYLYYLTQADCMFYIPIKRPRSPGYYGRTESFPWGENVREVEAHEVKNLELDCILFQSNYNPSNPDHDYLKEQMEILSQFQKKYVPKLFLEHDPPRSHPTDTRHILYNVPIPIVHVTFFNQLMWDCGVTPTTVIEHGVTIGNTNSSLELEKGIVVINNLYKRGRRLGLDVFEKVRKEIPLDVIGMGSENLEGLGEIPPMELSSVISKYRFFFSPIRYTSLGLSTIEAMASGLPVVGLATTELSTVIQNGKNGFIDTNIDLLIAKMKELLMSKSKAQRMGKEANKTAEKRFSIKRFSKEWQELFMHISAVSFNQHSNSSFFLPSY